MPPSRIRAISFDLDDTLWPFHTCLARAEAVLLAWLRERAPGAAGILDRPGALQAYRLRAETEHPELVGDLKGLRHASIRAMLVDAGEDTGLVDEAYAVFYEERLRVDVFDDVAPTLARLGARFPLVALSNGNACVHRAGIGHFFKGALHSTVIGVAKPDAQAFRAAADLAGVHIAELLHVGDDWALDVQGALDAGAQAAWIRRDGCPAATESADRGGTHLTLSGIASLCEVLEIDSRGDTP